MSKQEQLEADVYEICRGDSRDRYLALKNYCNVNGLDVEFDSIFANYEGHLFKTVLKHLLNRQAIISWDHAWEAQKDLIAEMQAEIDELTAEHDKLSNAINELQKKQPYCYNQEQPLDTLNTIGRYIDELTAERDELLKRSKQLEAEWFGFRREFLGRWGEAEGDVST